MAYIRIKKFKGNSYAYLVENRSTSKGPRQKVKKYLGRVHELEENGQSDIQQDKSLSLLPNLVVTELKKRGFKKKGNNYVSNNLIFNSKKNTLTRRTKSNSVKEAILSLNEGFLCSFSLQRLTSFKKTKDFTKDAHNLAKYFLEAGLLVSEENFVKFYQELK